MIRSFIAPGLLLGALASAVSAQLSTVPTDIQGPGSQPSEVFEVLEPIDCLACHGLYDKNVEPFRNWQGSMMSQAARDPLFWACVAVAEQDFPGSGDLCIRCHTPRGWLGNRSTPTDGSALVLEDAHGVSCDVCHRMTNPDTSEWTGEQYSPFLAHDGAVTPEGYYGSGMYVLQDNWEPRFGPYDDALGLHQTEQSLFHRKADLCGTCHDVSNPAVGDLAPNNGHQVPLAGGTFSGTPGTPVTGKAAFNNFPFQYGIIERTYSEHQASAFESLPVADYATLPADLKAGAIKEAYEAAVAAGGASGNYFDGATRTFTCQTCHMPPRAGKGCSLPFAPDRTDVPLHDLTGANTWTPRAIKYLDDQSRLVLGNGQLTSSDYESVDDGVERARANLRRAASLSLDGNNLTVVNLTGHKLISGYPEGRRMWLNMKWFDAAGTLLREDGAYGKLTADINGTPTTVRSLLDLDGTYTRIYQAKMGMTQAWAADLIGMGNSASLPLVYDRLTGDADMTLGDLAVSTPGTVHESFHFVLNNTIVSDTRIPPYGLDYDEAQTRGALPVPDTQYGNPGTGGTFTYKDTLALSPPSGAVHGTITLYYQTTSWEYIQFLHEANDGSVSTLATTGDDLLEAWLATGMSKPEIMTTIAWPGGLVPDNPPIGARGDPGLGGRRDPKHQPVPGGGLQTLPGQ